MKTKQHVIIKLFVLIAAICLASNTYAQDTLKEKAVKAYYNGFVTKDWNMVVSQLADGFTFTSPAPDNDHIPVDKFKEECWGTSKFTKSVSFIKMFEKGDELVLLVEIKTTDDKTVRNIDVYDFTSAGKIKAVEVFFGAGIGFPGNTKENK
jgi:hypothetical protein